MKSVKGQIVLKFLDHWPHLPSLSLAKLIYKNNKSAFIDVENVRTVIRYYRGQAGDARRADLQNKEHVTTSKAQHAKALGMLPIHLDFQKVMKQNGNHSFFQNQPQESCCCLTSMCHTIILKQSARQLNMASNRM
jgi:hypothetical protein